MRLWTETGNDDLANCLILYVYTAGYLPGVFTLPYATSTVYLLPNYYIFFFHIFGLDTGLELMSELLSASFLLRTSFFLQYLSFSLSLSLSLPSSSYQSIYSASLQHSCFRANILLVFPFHSPSTIPRATRTHNTSPTPDLSVAVMQNSPSTAAAWRLFQPASQPCVFQNHHPSTVPATTSSGYLLVGYYTLPAAQNVLPGSQLLV
jgi:hypothetical protein